MFTTYKEYKKKTTDLMNNPDSEKIFKNNYVDCISYQKNKVFNDWEISKNDVIIFSDKILGKGSFSTVYLSKWRNTLVVCKIPHNKFYNDDNFYLVEREIDICTKLHHPNIVQFLGYIKDPFMIIIEYIDNGNLLDNYRKINKNKKISIMKDLLQGISYIHNRRPNRLIHRDIKLNNILINKNFKAKISDFGLSRFFKTIKYNSFNDLKLCESIEDLTIDVGTKRYKAPECSHQIYNHKVDIYSLGIVLYELFEKRRYLPDNEFKYYYCPKKLRNYITQMIDKQSENRPEAIYLLDIISLHYPKLDLV